MTKTLIHDARIVFPGEAIAAGSILIDDGRIAQIGEVAQRPPDAERIDGGGRLLTPGLIDVHTHGIEHFQYDSGPDQLVAAAAVLGRYGTTCIVPTLVPHVGPKLFPRLERLAAAIPGIRTVFVPGLHIEGPFVAIAGAACPTVAGDLGLLEEILAACAGRVSVMSLSPETPNILPVIERLCERGVVPFMTHTRATPEQTQAAIDAGARHATHFYDVYPVPPETEPGARPAGAVEAILADPRATVDFICDGCHVHPVAIRAALAAKGYEGVILISDSNVGAGLPPGEYDTPWGYRVRVRPGDGARHVTENWLAGSALTMNVGMANLLRWLNRPAEQVWAMGTSNPARLLRLADRGVIRAGAVADLVLWNDDLTPAATFAAGKRVFPQQSEPGAQATGGNAKRR